MNEIEKRIDENMKRIEESVAKLFEELSRENKEWLDRKDSTIPLKPKEGEAA